MYIRFGDLPEGNSSHQATGCEEPGVSCFAADVEPDGTIRISGSRYLLQQAEAYSRRTCYEATGDFVDWGTDGEPCLDRETIELRELDLYEVELYAGREILGR